jgi:hypothetical protein
LDRGGGEANCNKLCNEALRVAFSNEPPPGASESETEPLEVKPNQQAERQEQ